MPRLLEQVRDQLRTRHYSYRTEQTYLQWIKQFILFHDKRHPALLGVDDIGHFLTHLAVKRTVSASTQNQALAALLSSTNTSFKSTFPGSRMWRAQRSPFACR